MNQEELPRSFEAARNPNDLVLATFTGERDEAAEAFLRLVEMRAALRKVAGPENQEENDAGFLSSDELIADIRRMMPEANIRAEEASLVAIKRRSGAGMGKAEATLRNRLKDEENFAPRIAQQMVAGATLEQIAGLIKSVDNMNIRGALEHIFPDRDSVITFIKAYRPQITDKELKQVVFGTGPTRWSDARRRSRRKP